MILIVAGSRTINDYSFVKKILDKHCEEYGCPNMVVSGTANGADMLGERWAAEKQIAIWRMPANWDKFGKSAGFIRNEAMADMADACVVLWDGVSKGSKNMIDIAERKGLKVYVYERQQA